MADNGAYKKYLYEQQQNRIKSNTAKYAGITTAAPLSAAEKTTISGPHQKPPRDPFADARNNAGRAGYDEAGSPIDPFAAARANAGRPGYDESGDPVDAFANERANAGRPGYDEAGTKINSDGTPGGTQSISANGASSGADGGGNPDSNPLDNYADYTYSLNLSVLPPSDYNGLGNGPFSADGKVLIASGGRRDSGFGRVAGFESDFYFDSFKMTTIVGVNNTTRGSNVIDMSFTVLEPYGMTLLDKILKVADTLGAKNWNEMPFVMQIDFYGNTNDDIPELIAGQTKTIPIKLIECKIKATTKGAEYQFHGIPYNHAAFQTNAVSTPAFNEVTAKTVGEFFSNAEDDKGSYASALNKYQQKLADANKKYQALPDKFEFEIDDEIKNAKIIADDKRGNVRNTPTANDAAPSSKKVDGKKAAEGGKPATVDLKTQVTAINAGTSIPAVIDQVIRNSSYFSEQVGKQGNDVIKSWKIIPKVEIMEFDNYRKCYQKKYIYVIKKSEYHNTKYPDAPTKFPKKISRQYDYMYTGKNQSIIDFNIDFNIVFYTAMTANRDKLKTTEIDPDSTKNERDKGTQAGATANKLDQSHTKTVGSNSDLQTSAQGTNDFKNVAANDLVRSMFTDSRGDMINIKLKIAGDPAFIKQDDVYFKPKANDNTPPGELDGANSFTTDGGELFVALNFRTPSDTNPTDDTYDFSESEKTAFSGTYRVITIENILERGVFTQTLDIIKVFDV